MIFNNSNNNNNNNNNNNKNNNNNNNFPEPFKIPGWCPTGDSLSHRWKELFSLGWQSF